MTDTAWLLESQIPTIRYLTRRDLLGLPDDDPQQVADRAAIRATGPGREILARQKSRGFWEEERSYYSPKYTSTHWSMLLLAELEVDPAAEGVQRGAAYMLQATQKHLEVPRKGWEIGLTCFWGNVLRYSLYAGQEDHPQIARIVEFTAREAGRGWRCPYNSDLPCAWGAARALWGLAALPGELRSAPEVQGAVERALGFLLDEYALVEADYPADRKPHPLWYRLNFPLFYQTDILFVLRVLSEWDALEYPAAARALVWLSEQKGKNDRWRGASPFRSRTYPEVSPVEETGRWVTLQAGRLLAGRSR